MFLKCSRVTLNQSNKEILARTCPGENGTYGHPNLIINKILSMSLEWLSTLSYWGIRPFKKSPSPLVTSGQHMLCLFRLLRGNLLVTFQLINFLRMSLLSCFAKA